LIEKKFYLIEAWVFVVLSFVSSAVLISSIWLRGLFLPDSILELGLALAFPVLFVRAERKYRGQVPNEAQRPSTP
jgi:hypothetical protein